MGEDWTTPDVLDSLAAALRARPALATDVEIRTAHPGTYHAFADAIAFFGSEHEERPASLGGEDFDYFEIYGSVYVRRAGIGENVAKTVRDRTKTLYGELLDEISSDRSIGGLLMRSRVNVAEFNQGTIPDDSWAEVRFRIECWASPT